MKRFQECNKLVQIWRYRWYLVIPFIFLWRMWEFRNDIDNYLNRKLIWRLLIGEMQIKMRWYYTPDEVYERLKVNKKSNLQ
jgi:hypothetical protein